MKIAQIVCAYPPYQGGIGNSAKKFQELLEKKHQIKNFTPQYNKEQKREEDNIIRLKPLIKYGNAAILPQFFYLLKKYDCVLLHYPFFGTDIVIWLYKIFLGRKKKLIIHYHMDSKLNFWTKLFSLTSLAIKKSLLKKADKITCFSLDYIKNSQIAKFYKKNKDKFIEVPYGIDIKKFHPRGKEVKEKTMKIIFVGGLDKAHYFKGLKVLIEALELSKEKIKLSVVGEGDRKKYFKKLVKKESMEDKIYFLDSIKNSELPNIYRENEILVLPSINKNEALGIVLLEAMASGLGVVASNLPGVRSVFNDRKEGLLIKANDSEDLKEKLDQLAKNYKLRKAMGKRGRKKIKEKYSLDKMSEKLNSIF